MAETLTNLGTAYQLAGKGDAAKDAFSKSIGIMRNLYGIDSNKLSQVKQQFTRTLMQTGELSGPEQRRGQYSLLDSHSYR